MADAKFVRKFTGGPFKGLVFEKHDVPDRYDMIELKFAGGKKIVVTAQEYRDWPEANAGTVAPRTSLLAEG